MSTHSENTNKNKKGLWGWYRKQHTTFKFVVLILLLTLIAEVGIAITVTESKFFMLFIIGILGFALGIFFGMLFTPYDEIEKKRFKPITGLIVSFLSGFGLAEVSKFTSSDFLYRDDHVRFENLALVCVLLICLVIGFLAGYRFRLIFPLIKPFYTNNRRP